MNTESHISLFCSQIGQDPWLVQGAGGNVSWKDRDTLWIKASGTRLSEALTKQIFVPVNLTGLRLAIETKNFSAAAEVQNNSPLKPSIETFLHALMPDRIVVHLHAISSLKFLVLKNAKQQIAKLFPNGGWVFVDYKKPGEELAKQVFNELKTNPSAKLIFLKNHGLVFSGNTLEEVEHLLKQTLHTLGPQQPFVKESERPNAVLKETENNSFELKHYKHIEYKPLQQLALQECYFNLLQTCWALYPDHVAFLGQKAHCYESFPEFQMPLENKTQHPELVFIKNSGVLYNTQSFTLAKNEQLLCYWNVLSQISNFTEIEPLTHEQIEELINWDAEKYRMQLSSK